MVRNLKALPTHIGKLYTSQSSAPVTVYLLDSDKFWKSASTGFLYSKDTGLAAGLAPSNWHFKKLDLSTVRPIGPNDRVPYKVSKAERRQKETAAMHAPFFKIYKAGELVATVKLPEYVIAVFKACKGDSCYIGSNRLAFHAADIKRLSTADILSKLEELCLKVGAPIAEANFKGKHG